MKALTPKRAGALSTRLRPMAAALKRAEWCHRELRTLPAGVSRLHSIRPDASMVPLAAAVRAKMLPDFIETKQAWDVLADIRYGTEVIDAQTAIALVGGLFNTLAKKKTDDENAAAMLAACLDMFDPEADAVGVSLGLWKPVPKHPVAVTLAVKSLINTAVFSPTPAELRAACERVHHKIGLHEADLCDWCSLVSEAGAILFEFDYDAWERAYTTPASLRIAEQMVEVNPRDEIGDALESMRAKVDAVARPRTIELAAPAGRRGTNEIAKF